MTAVVDLEAALRQDPDRFENMPSNVRRAIYEFDCGDHSREAWAAIRVAFEATIVDRNALLIVNNEIREALGATAQGSDAAEIARELRALKARVEGAPVADRTHPLGEALRASGYYAGASVRIVAESGEE